MVIDGGLTITYGGWDFSYDDACEIAKSVTATIGHKMTCIELEGVTDTTPAALARLVLLRMNLLKSGRDLRIVGLRKRA